MNATRREWLQMAAGGAIVPLVNRRVFAQGAATNSAVLRIANIVAEYEAQGDHRTATNVDEMSGRWLAERVRQVGLTPALEPFPINRVDLVACELMAAGRRLDGIPLFDAAFTSADGIVGRLGPLGSDAEIGLAETTVNAAAAGPLGDARRAGRHRAIVAVTRGSTPGLCPSNAGSFLNPFGPPVLQVSSESSDWLADHARQGTTAHVVAHVGRVETSALNVTAEQRGTAPTLPPVVVMTPRSGWYRCASERGGGIACWLEIIRGVGAAPTQRTVQFVASSGHELSHLGIDAYIARRPGVVQGASAWLHLGANIGAATDLANNLLQASHDDLDRMLTDALKSSGIGVARRAPRGNVPGGEAEAVHRGGGRYVSAIGGNTLFHSINDRGTDATNPQAIARFGQAFTTVVRSLANTV
jgi:hypothetical protein